jgi:hypothetical protein
MLLLLFARPLWPSASSSSPSCSSPMAGRPACGFVRPRVKQCAYSLDSLLLGLPGLPHHSLIVESIRCRRSLSFVCQGIPPSFCSWRRTEPSLTAADACDQSTRSAQHNCIRRIHPVRCPRRIASGWQRSVWGYAKSSAGSCTLTAAGCIRLRPYSVKSTVSRPNCAVKPLQALSVLRWGTTWESGVP